MDTRSFEAGRGLRLMFWGELLFLAGSLSRLGVLAEIVWIMGAVISLFAGLAYLLFLRDIQN